MTVTKPQQAPAVILLLLLAVSAALGLGAFRPPPPEDASAPETEFSAARAREHLAVIAAEPHPLGSRAHRDVREYLLGALTELGVNPLMQHTVTTAAYDPSVAAEIYNIVARIPGTDSSGAIALMSHYDSVPSSHGASDAGAGVAAILETVRILQLGPELRNDVIILLTDGEELGLLGARAFVAEHPWFEEIAIVLNVEARGSSGPSVMFQTTGPSGLLIETLAEAAPHPVANSLMQEVYERLPNGTDLSAFMEQDVAGMDFAFFRGLSHYHTPLDRLETQSPASLQHHGSYLVSMARALGEVDLAAADRPEQTYFNFGSLAFVRYPVAWILPFALLVAAAVVAYGARGFATGALRSSRVVAGLVVAAATLGIGVQIGRWAWAWAAASSESARWDPHRLFYGSTPFVLAACAATAAVAAMLLWVARRWCSAAELFVPPLVAWALLGVAAAIATPGVSYLFSWPALGALLGFAALRQDERDGPMAAVLLGLGALPALALVFVWVVWLEIALTFRLVYASTGLLALVLILLAPQLDMLLRAWGLRVPALLALIAAASLVWGAWTPEYDERRPRPGQLSYSLDADEGTAYWTSVDPEVGEWTGQALGADPARQTLPDYGFGERSLLATPAAPLSVPAPDIEILSDETRGDRRVLTVRVAVPPETLRTSVDLMPGSRVLSATLEGRWPLTVPVEEVAAPQRLTTLLGSPAEGFALELEVAPGAVTPIRVRTERSGLPQDFGPRPASRMTRGDTTRVQRTIAVGGGEPTGLRLGPRNR